MNNIILRVDNNTTYIDGRLQSAIYQSFRKELGYLPENSFWMIRNLQEESKDKPEWKSNWDGYVSTVCWNGATCRCNVKKRGTHFPTGLLFKALSFFDSVGVKYSIQDIRTTFAKTTNYSMSDNFEHRDYQIDVINKIVGNSEYKGVDRGIVKLCTGAGKTPVSCGIISGIGVSPTIFYVTSVELLYQAKSEIEKFVRYLGKEIEVGVIGGGKREIRDINVMTVQTAVRALGGVWVKYDEEDNAKDETNIENKEEIRDLIRSAKLIICDECLAGDTLIDTEKGKVRISDVSKLKCEYVLSHNGDKTVWKKINAFMPKGEKKVLKVTLGNGREIRCTSNHLFMTKDGWIESGKLQKGGEVFVCDQRKNDERNINSLSENLPYSSVGVEKKLSQNVRPLSYLSKTGELKNIGSICMGTESVPQNVCSTNFETVVSVKEDGCSDVFDIEVEDVHCFFANDILVHNCQHWSSETCQIISDNSIYAQYRFAMSATPYRDSGDDILIDACFGRVIADINASFLIKRNYLVKPTIYFSPMSRLRGISDSSYPSLYKKAIVENGERNKRIVDLANEFKDRERKVLILVKHIVHGNLLEKLIPDSVFLYGSTSKKKRMKHLEMMREGEPFITISSVIFDEGIDVRPLDTLILAGSGKSSTRALQRIGRILRPYEGKEDAIAVDFMDQCRHLKSHSLKRLSIYKTEEEFEIIGSKS